MVDEIHSGEGQRSSVQAKEAAPAGVEGRGAATSQEAKERTRAVWDDARANMRSALEGRQQEAATGAGDVAGALRNAARQLEEQHKSSSARLVDNAAEGLERLADTLRHKNLDAMVHDAESFARREPGLFFGTAVAIGFLAARFLKSSSQQGERTHAMGEGSTTDVTHRETGPLH